MLVIGLTGGIGSGKTTVANLFAKKGITIVDTDQLARDVITPETLKKISEKFGNDILSLDKNLNRAKLREIIFNDENKRVWLENLLHPLIIEKMHQEIAASKSPYCIVVIPLLFETAPYSIIDRILVVDATEDQQIERTVMRDNTSQDAIKKILKTQVSRQHRLKQADDIVQNTGDLKNLENQINQLHEKYIALHNNSR